MSDDAKQQHQQQRSDRRYPGDQLSAGRTQPTVEQPSRQTATQKQPAHGQPTDHQQAQQPPRQTRPGPLRRPRPASRRNHHHRATQHHNQPGQPAQVTCHSHLILGRFVASIAKPGPPTAHARASRYLLVRDPHDRLHLLDRVRTDVRSRPGSDVLPDRIRVVVPGERLGIGDDPLLADDLAELTKRIGKCLVAHACRQRTVALISCTPFRIDRRPFVALRGQAGRAGNPLAPGRAAEAGRDHRTPIHGIDGPRAPRWDAGRPGSRATRS